MEPGHAGELAIAGDDPEIWRYLPYGPCRTPESMAELIDELLKRQRAGTDLAFSVRLQRTRELIGMTRFLSIERGSDSAEIGGTWYSAKWRRTPVNTESKRLLLAHAFDVEGAHRVQLRTDLRNDRSQRAIERLGAVREGVIREHRRMPDGYWRSSVQYSILVEEWPRVRERLDGFLARPWEPPSRDRGTGPSASR